VGLGRGRGAVQQEPCDEEQKKKKKESLEVYQKGGSQKKKGEGLKNVLRKVALSE